MINKIINTPYFGVSINNHLKNKYNKNIQIYNKNLSRDTVTFTSEGKASQKLINKTINLAFKKLEKNLYQKRKYTGITKNKVNVAIQETSYDNDLILTLNNINFKNNCFALFEFYKSNNKPSKIISLGKNNTVTDEKTVKMINNILEDLY